MGLRNIHYETCQRVHNLAGNTMPDAYDCPEKATDNHQIRPEWQKCTSHVIQEFQSDRYGTPLAIAL